MTDFTPEQVKEIRRRIEAVPFAGRHYAGPDIFRVDALAAFPLPKVTRYRTFRTTTDTYRVNSDIVEYLTPNGEEWREAAAGQSRNRFAQDLARKSDWQTLATFADICARPTEEIEP